MVTDQQVRKLMEEHKKTGEVGVAAMKASMDRKTARKYLAAGKLPSQLKNDRRTYRTREDPFAGDWPGMAAMLMHAPELEGKSLFEHLMAKHPGRYDAGQVRTFQRRVKTWRAKHGPEQEVFFPQLHPAGDAMQTDFTWCTELEITLAGEPFPHMLCHAVLPYSNWESATICRSESMAALRDGVQNALFALGRVPTWHQTDNSTAATHAIGKGDRDFNQEYVDLMKHLGMKPRTIGVGKSEQNGDVEASNGVLKRRLEQHLLLRGSRDFPDEEAYNAWLQQVLAAANALRTRLPDDLAAMKPLVATRLLDYKVIDVRVSKWCTIRVMHNAYSLPSRLIGETVRVRLYEDRLEVWYADRKEAKIPRQLGRNGHQVDYRHIIFWLVRKPGAFRNYRYRQDLFPSLVFRRAYDALSAVYNERNADMEYLRILNLAATTFEADVELALGLVLDTGDVPTALAVRELVTPQATTPATTLKPYTAELGIYDAIARVGGAR